MSLNNQYSKYLAAIAGNEANIFYVKIHIFPIFMKHLA